MAMADCREDPQDESNGDSQDDHRHDPGAQEPVEMSIDGTLDLHMFSPRDVRPLLRDYIEACRQRGILDLRIVHGKGSGVLRRIVQAELARHAAVLWFGHQEGAGSWGATVVRLAPADENQEPCGH
jgi:DNA-nicking Smr family endonuclease